MIKLHNKMSLDGLPLEDNIKAFLMGYLQDYLEEYEVDTIETFGEIQYLENSHDIQTYQDIGLAEYLVEWGCEWIEKTKLNDGTILFIISVVLSTDYGLNIIVTESLLDTHTMTILNSYINKENSNV